MTPVLLRQLSQGQQIVDDLPEVDVDAGLYLETEVEVHAEDIIRAVGLHLIIHLIRIVGGIDADEPVGVRPLRVLIQDGIQDVPVDLFKIVALGQIHYIIAAQGDGIVVLQVLDGVQVVPHIQMDILGLFDLSAPIPADHDEEDGRGDDDSHIAADHELAQAGNEEHALEGKEYQAEQEGGDPLFVQDADIDAEHGRHHQHADGDRQTVGVLYAGAGAEVKDHSHTEYPQDVIDERNVDLPFGIRGIAHVQMGHQVQVGGFVHQGVAAADQGLTGDDGRQRAQEDGHRSEGCRQHHVERIEVADGL